jgi:hypothetical protein
VLNSLSVTDVDFNNNDSSDNITNNLFDRYLKPELIKLLDDDNNMASVSSQNITKFVKKTRSDLFNKISEFDEIRQELFLLHQICKSLYYFNNNYLNYSHKTFRTRVLFPNLVYILIRHFNIAHNFLRKTIRSVFSELKKHSYGLIQKHINSYYLDEEIIKIDILYEFLGNALKKFDPTVIRNLNNFYRQVFRNILSYYLRKEHKIDATYSDLLSIDIASTRLMGSPARLKIYRNVLYKLQVKKFCLSSFISHQLNYNFDIFRNVVISNEFQNLFLSGSASISSDSKYKLIKTFSGLSPQKINNKHNNFNNIIKELKKLPVIYKLLKCVHIMNPKVRPYNEKLFKPKLVKLAVFEELMSPFKNNFADKNMMEILDRISMNFTNSILTGEYINLFTLTTVKINQFSFISQTRKFVRLCLKNIPETKD